MCEVLHAQHPKTWLAIIPYLPKQRRLTLHRLQCRHDARNIASLYVFNRDDFKPVFRNCLSASSRSASVVWRDTVAHNASILRNWIGSGKTGRFYAPNYRIWVPLAVLSICRRRWLFLSNPRWVLARPDIQHHRLHRIPRVYWNRRCWFSKFVAKGAEDWFVLRSEHKLYSFTDPNRWGILDEKLINMWLPNWQTQPAKKKNNSRNISRFRENKHCWI